MESLDRRSPNRHLVWLAAPETRGHLDRARIMRGLLAERDIEVHVFTTDRRGVAYLESLGCPATLLESDYRVAYDARQNLDRRATAARMLRYFVDPRQFFDDLQRLRRVARHSVFVVNDFHPSLMVGGSILQSELRTVHLYGNNLWHAIARPFRQPVGRFANPICSGLLDRLRSDGAARVIHRPLAPMEARWTASNTVELPPLVPEPLGTAGGDDETTMAVRLNPQFHDPAVARSIERVAERLDAELHAVAEGFSDRAGWRAGDRDFASRAAEADLLVSTAEMRTIGLARAYDIPTAMVLPDQPEQRRNANALVQAADTPACRRIDLDAPRLYRSLFEAAQELLEESDGAASRGGRVGAIHRAWRDAFARLTRQLDTRRTCAVA